METRHHARARIAPTDPSGSSRELEAQIRKRIEEKTPIRASGSGFFLVALRVASRLNGCRDRSDRESHRRGNLPGRCSSHQHRHWYERSRTSTQRGLRRVAAWRRSEEHTSELQSPCNLVCRLLLEKKKA